MQSKAYVLIEAEAGQVGHILEKLKSVPGVAHADAVTGPYDVIATLETSDSREIGRLVMHELHGVAGIKRTVTCLAI